MNCTAAAAAAAAWRWRRTSITWQPSMTFKTISCSQAGACVQARITHTTHTHARTPWYVSLSIIHTHTHLSPSVSMRVWVSIQKEWTRSNTPHLLSLSPLSTPRTHIHTHSHTFTLTHTHSKANKDSELLRHLDKSTLKLKCGLDLQNWKIKPEWDQIDSEAKFQAIFLRERENAWIEALLESWCQYSSWRNRRLPMYLRRTSLRAFLSATQTRQLTKGWWIWDLL